MGATHQLHFLHSYFLVQVLIDFSVEHARCCHPPRWHQTLLCLSSCITWLQMLHISLVRVAWWRSELSSDETEVWPIEVIEVWYLLFPFTLFFRVFLATFMDFLGSIMQVVCHCFLAYHGLGSSAIHYGCSERMNSQSSLNCLPRDYHEEVRLDFNTRNLYNTKELKE